MKEIHRDIFVEIFVIEIAKKWQSVDPAEAQTLEFSIFSLECAIRISQNGSLIVFKDEK